MKTITIILTTVILASILSGCVRAPFVPPQGAFSQTTAPLDLDFYNTELAGMKRGTAEVMTVLGLVSLGDASSKTAAENGQISTVVHADYEYLNIFGILQKTTVVVYGK